MTDKELIKQAANEVLDAVMMAEQLGAPALYDGIARIQDLAGQCKTTGSRQSVMNHVEALANQIMTLKGASSGT